MNINKQLTKGNKMKKVAMVISVLTVLATNANATGWGSGSSIWTNQITVVDIISTLEIHS